MNNVKCPHCNDTITHIEVQDASLTVASQPRYKGIVYLCPACRAVLDVQMNPLAIQADIVNQLRSLLDEQ